MCRKRRHEALLNAIQAWTQWCSRQLQGERDEDISSNPSGLAPSEMMGGKKLVLNNKLEKKYHISLVIIFPVIGLFDTLRDALAIFLTFFSIFSAPFTLKGGAHSLLVGHYF